jgi:protein ImuB
MLGEDLVPSIGWDTGKFTARAAASYTKPGHMRLVDRTHEEPFLRPLSIALLPLSPLALQQLSWLGIRTLGQFAQLPKTAVWQRFGAEVKLAQQWAQGRDARPVRPTVEEAAPPLAIDFDPPTGLHGDVLEAVLSSLHPALPALAKRLEGCRRLRLDLNFADDSTRKIDYTFVGPVVEESRLRATLSHQLQVLNWPAELASLKLSLLECGELVPRRLMLFELDSDRSPLLQLAEKLSGRYRDIFFRLCLSDEGHPLSERRSSLTAFSTGYAV